MKLIYEKEDIQEALNAVNRISVKGIENAKQIVMIATILANGNLEQPEQEKEERQ